MFDLLRWRRLFGCFHIGLPVAGQKIKETSYDCGGSRAFSAARAARSSSSMSTVSGCVPPNTRRAVRSVSSIVVTASRRSSSVAAGSSDSPPSAHRDGVFLGRREVEVREVTQTTHRSRSGRRRAARPCSKVLGIARGSPRTPRPGAATAARSRPRKCAGRPAASPEVLIDRPSRSRAKRPPTTPILHSEAGSAAWTRPP